MALNKKKLKIKCQTKAGTTFCLFEVLKLKKRKKNSKNETAKYCKNDW